MCAKDNETSDCFSVRALDTHTIRAGGSCDRAASMIILSVFFLACMNSSALADWTFLTAAEDADWYVDYILVRKRGSMVKVWTLQQFATGQPLYSGEYLSAKTQAEIRCHSKQWRVLYFSWYSGPMGGGETPGAWKAVARNDASEALYEFGCHPEKIGAPSK